MSRAQPALISPPGLRSALNVALWGIAHSLSPPCLTSHPTAAHVLGSRAFLRKTRRSKPTTNTASLSPVHLSCIYSEPALGYILLSEKFLSSPLNFSRPLTDLSSTSLTLLQHVSRSLTDPVCNTGPMGRTWRYLAPAEPAPHPHALDTRQFLGHTVPPLPLPACAHAASLRLEVSLAEPAPGHATTRTSFSTKSSRTHTTQSPSSQGSPCVLMSSPSEDPMTR